MRLRWLTVALLFIPAVYADPWAGLGNAFSSLVGILTAVVAAIGTLGEPIPLSATELMHVGSMKAMMAIIIFLLWRALFKKLHENGQFNLGEKAQLPLSLVFTALIIIGIASTGLFGVLLPFYSGMILLLSLALMLVIPGYLLYRYWQSNRTGESSVGATIMLGLGLMLFSALLTGMVCATSPSHAMCSPGVNSGTTIIAPITAGASCGNGVVDAGEDCDDAEFAARTGTKSCTTAKQGHLYSGGDVSCKSCSWDMSACIRRSGGGSPGVPSVPTAPGGSTGGTTTVSTTTSACPVGVPSRCPAMEGPGPTDKNKYGVPYSSWRGTFAKCLNLDKEYGGYPCTTLCTTAQAGVDADKAFRKCTRGERVGSGTTTTTVVTQ